MNAEKMDFWLQENNACSDGYNWAKGKSLKEIWTTCERPDWMLWLYERRKPNKKTAIKISIFCAKLALPLFESKHPNDTRPRHAIEAAKKVLKNDTKKNRELAASASASASAASASASYASAASAASASASYASYASAAASAAYEDARKEIQIKICNYIRKLIKEVK